MLSYFTILWEPLEASALQAMRNVWHRSLHCLHNLASSLASLVSPWTTIGDNRSDTFDLSCVCHLSTSLCLPFLHLYPGIGFPSNVCEQLLIKCLITCLSIPCTACGRSGNQCHFTAVSQSLQKSTNLVVTKFGEFSQFASPSLLEQTVRLENPDDGERSCVLFHCLICCAIVGWVYLCKSVRNISDYYVFWQ